VYTDRVEASEAVLLEPLDEHQVKQLFPRAQARELGMPNLDYVDWGILDYFGWIHPGGHMGYVVMPIHGELRSLRLRRTLSSSARPRTHMCSWCHHVYRGRGTAMFSTYVQGSDERRLIGNHICSQLDCSLRIRNLTSDPPTYMPETIELARKVQRLENAVVAFMARANLLQA
jgi:hypothetical protein